MWQMAYEKSAEKFKYVDSMFSSLNVESTKLCLRFLQVLAMIRSGMHALKGEISKTTFKEAISYA